MLNLSILDSGVRSRCGIHGIMSDSRWEKTRKGNRAGITVCKHKLIPSIHPLIAVFLSKIKVSMESPQNRHHNIFFIFDTHNTPCNLMNPTVKSSPVLHSLSQRGVLMNRHNKISKKILRRMEAGAEPILLQPLLELCSDKRLLIENHESVLQYSLEQIQVRVKYGILCIHGARLRLCTMSNYHLVIQGRIDSIQIIRRNCQ